MTHPITTDALRVGMFIHLNTGWMKHPFPLSSFKLISQDQIDTIRGLGLSGLTWSPERSELELQDADSAGSASSASALLDAEARADEAGPAQIDPRQAARLALAAQRELMNRCERQFIEACRDLRRTTDKALTDPAQARADAQTLAQALLDKMLVEGEPCLRVLGEMGTDRAATHAMNVTVIALMLARQLEVPQAMLLDLGVGSLLHDIGKVAIPDRVRLPREDFSAAEAAIYRDHVAQGLLMARRMGLSSEAQLVIAQHHELADGTGFPSALMLQRMSLAARIVAMVNRYDNLCNAATPAQSLTPHEALSRMFAQSRNKFDQVLLNGFIKMMGIYPPGSIVQLNDERYGMVMTVNAAHPLKPRVLVFDPGVPADEALHLDLEKLPTLGIRRSLRAAQMPVRAAEYLRPRQRVAYFFDVEPAPAVQEPDEVSA